MSNPWDDTEDGHPPWPEGSPPDPVHYTETKDLRTMIRPPVCGHDMATASTSVTNLPSRVTCTKCKTWLGFAPPPEDD